MGEKTAGVGHFAIPTAPAAGASVTSGAANTFTTTYVALSAAAPAAIFITGIYVEQAAVSAGTYIVVQLATGAAGSEAIVGQHLIAPVTGSTVARAYKPIYPPIPVANGIRIAAKTADSAGALASLITLECINQSNVVDDGVAVGTVTTVTAVTGLTASNLDAAISTRMATYTQPTGFLAATFPTGTVANTTNITAGTMTTTTNLTNAATAGDLTSTMKTSVTTAATAATPTAAAVTGAVGSVTAAVTLPAIPSNWITAAGITASALNGKGDWPVGKTGYSLTTSDWAKAGDAMTLTAAYDAAKTALASSGYTAPDNASITAIKAKTDSLTFTVAGFIDSNILKVKGTTITGSGTSGSPWGP